ncbi:hypothetical protein RISK_002240 [Rhodopirellula islandica]|uniref:Uncharacterized protein n=1 Tax=Rhodopirellula islandica TaxID=595434 RepID=A0A0J1BGE8_RHOIS|nr:hypothetical protein RISK_002240 [Rhodopirellula islandica]
MRVLPRKKEINSVLSHSWLAEEKVGEATPQAGLATATENWSQQ